MIVSYSQKESEIYDILIENRWNMVLYNSLEKKLKLLPQTALEEISSYVDYILFKFTTLEKSASSQSQKKGFGCLKDIPCKMSPDFDEPIEEFAEYM